MNFCLIRFQSGIPLSVSIYPEGRVLWNSCWTVELGVIKVNHSLEGGCHCELSNKMDKIKVLRVGFLPNTTPSPQSDQFV